MKAAEAVEPGRIVRVLRGREVGRPAVIIGAIDEKFVWIADGDKRKFDQPKKKNVMHLQFTEFVSSEVADSIRDTGRVTNGKIRFALSRYLEEERAD